MEISLNAGLTSVETSYTRYLFRRKPCCPSTFTYTVSSFFHHSFGSPVPDILDGAPLSTLPALPSAGGDATVAEGNFGTLQGSSVEKARDGRPRGEDVYWPNPDVEGASESRSRLGMGRAFSCANAATLSILMSVLFINDSIDRYPTAIPLPDCARAASARATKNSNLDTRGRELTKLTIYRRSEPNEQQLCWVYLINRGS